MRSAMMRWGNDTSRLLPSLFRAMAAAACCYLTLFCFSTPCFHFLGCSSLYHPALVQKPDKCAPKLCEKTTISVRTQSFDGFPLFLGCGALVWLTPSPLVPPPSHVPSLSHTPALLQASSSAVGGSESDPRATARPHAVQGCSIPEHPWDGTGAAALPQAPGRCSSRDLAGRCLFESKNICSRDQVLQISYACLSDKGLGSSGISLLRGDRAEIRSSS